MFADSLTKSLQGSTFRRFWSMIKGIPESTPDVEMICLRDMSKVISHENVGQNKRKTHGTATARTDSRRDTCTDARGITCTEK